MGRTENRKVRKIGRTADFDARSAPRRGEGQGWPESILPFDPPIQKSNHLPRLKDFRKDIKVKGGDLSQDIPPSCEPPPYLLISPS